MSTEQAYKRLQDENYRNWLKTAESLSLLRIRLRDFIEKETETYHSFLRNNPALSGKTCAQACDSKKNNKPSLCNLCNKWKNEISNNHKTPKTIFWDNCKPHLWPTNKWEVAKAYMARGHKDHRTFEEFDVSAIFNLMSFCKHFQNDIKKCVDAVVHVRNRVMHSPDFKMSNADMQTHLDKVLEMAEKLKPRVPELKNLKEEINEFNKILDKNFSQAPQCEVDGKQEDIQNLKEIQKVLDREQQAMKEKFEDFLLNFEGNHDETVKVQSHDLLDFLDQNKDLLENLGPQVNKLKGMQEKVDQHEQKITKLTDRMDHLDKVLNDPVLPGHPLKYKNHLYECCREMNWPEPTFTVEREAEGYKAKVEVNGQTFLGTKVCNSMKTAHQDVAHVALQNLKLQAENMDESSSSSVSSVSTETFSSSSSGTFFGKVTVFLDRDVASGGRCSNEEDAMESAYQVLWNHLQVVMGPVQAGQTYRSAVLEYFSKRHFQKPAEQLVRNDDNTTVCNLRLKGDFTFHDTVGSTRKKLAEQQAAEVALQHLSKFLNCSPISDTEKNFKGVLKESLETLGLRSPVYEADNKEGPSGTLPDLPNLSVTKASAEQSSDLKSESISTPSQLSSHPSHESVSGPPAVSLEPEDSSSPALLRKEARIDCPGNTYFGKVTVNLDREIQSDGCRSNEAEAAESAYRVLWGHFNISVPTEGQTYRSAVLEYFNKLDFQKPAEQFVQNDNDTTTCTLRLDGNFIFHDTVGSTKKKLAEQQAAEVALQHLSKFLNCSPMSDTEKNFKGVLKEGLETLGLRSPVYEADNKEGSSGTLPDLSNPCVNQATVKRSLDLKAPKESESISTPSQPSSHQSHESVCGSASVSIEPEDSSTPALQRKKARIDCPEIDALLSVCLLKPPQVKTENIKYDENYKCTVQIGLENYTFTNEKHYDSKKDAVRKTYLLFGCAVGIFEPSIDEKQSSAQVKQHFSQKSLPLPREEVEGSKEFRCSLKNLTYSFVYEEHGPSETAAKLGALQKALGSLLPLFGYPTRTGANSLEEVEKQLSVMLKEAGQKEPGVSVKGPLVKTCIQLCFTDYTVKCTCRSSKKAARNHLSSRILSLLGEKTDSDGASLRNCLDEWFKQRNLPQPVFEDAEEPVGAKATFSVQISCCTPDWEDSWEAARNKLVEELKRRFQFLTD